LFSLSAANDRAADMAETARAQPARRPSRRISPIAKLGPRSNIDIVLAASGVAIALSSMAFAGYMVADVDRPPRIAGMEYLSVFAKPNHALASDEGAAAPAPAKVAINAARPAIDLTPTGSIADKGGAGRSINLILTPDLVLPPTRNGDLKPSVAPYKLLDVANGEALIQSDIGFRHVRAGDTLPDLGRINTIEKRGDHWVLLTQNGAPLEWPTPSPAIAAPPAAPPAARKKVPAR
jgi:hypothetical protein